MAHAGSATKPQIFVAYRRFLGAVLTLLIAVLVASLYHGIVGTLKQAPGANAVPQTSLVSAASLKSCSEDLAALTKKTRITAGRLFGPSFASSSDAPRWRQVALPLEAERLKIVQRCRLDDPEQKPTQEALAGAASSLQDLLRNYGILYDRYLKDGLPHATSAHNQVEQAQKLLKR